MVTKEDLIIKALDDGFSSVNKRIDDYMSTQNSRCSSKDAEIRSLRRKVWSLIGTVGTLCGLHGIDYFSK